MNKTKAPTSKPEVIVTEKPFVIRYPILWLMGAVLVLYLGSLQFGLTELDDAIFIKERQAYVENVSNLISSFHHGVFSEAKDTYYRPLFIDSIILNYMVSQQSVMGYHFVNVMLHLLSVLLLFRLFIKLKINQTTAFLLTLLFAVHPVLTQAVVWVPGRNDTLMAVFVLPFLITAIDYAENRKPLSLVLSMLCLLAAVFTKETALLAPAVAFILLVIVRRHSWKDKALLAQYGTWVGALVIYFAVRSTASLARQNLVPGDMVHDFVGRLPLIIQYLGKIFLPFDLSVFPIQQDTGYVPGIAAVVLLILLIVLAKGKDLRTIIGGALIFIVFIIPVLFVPNKLNEQTFEHRLYLPIIGILLLLSQTLLFRNKLSERTIAIGIAAIAVVFGALNYRHQQNFENPISFWQQAVETSPHSAYATMMYAARVEDKQEGYALMRKAYALNPNEKYLNYYYGVMLQNQDSMLESEKYFLKEKKNSNYYECDYYLSQIAYKKNKPDEAEMYLESFLAKDSMNAPSSNNLLLLYVQAKKKDKALAHISTMQRRGVPVDPNLLKTARELQ